MKIARLARAIRVVKVLRFIRAMRVLVFSILNTLRSLVWSLVLLFVIIYSFGILFADATIDHILEHADSMPPGTRDGLVKHFGSLENEAAAESCTKCQSSKESANLTSKMEMMTASKGDRRPRSSPHLGFSVSPCESTTVHPSVVARTWRQIWVRYGKGGGGMGWGEMGGYGPMGGCAGGMGCDGMACGNGCGMGGCGGDGWWDEWSAWGWGDDAYRPEHGMVPMGGKGGSGKGGGPTPPAQSRAGDWTCECGNINFESRVKCNRHSCAKMKPGFVEGDWICRKRECRQHNNIAHEVDQLKQGKNFKDAPLQFSMVDIKTLSNGGLRVCNVLHADPSIPRLIPSSIVHGFIKSGVCRGATYLEMALKLRLPQLNVQGPSSNEDLEQVVIGGQPCKVSRLLAEALGEKCQDFTFSGCCAEYLQSLEAESATGIPGIECSREGPTCRWLFLCRELRSASISLQSTLS
eukprot:g6540.t2